MRRVALIAWIVCLLLVAATTAAKQVRQTPKPPPTDLSKVDPLTRFVDGNVELNLTQIWNADAETRLTITNGCLRLYGSLDLSLFSNTDPGTFNLLNVVEGCIDGQFRNIEYSTNGNTEICDVRAEYFPSRVEIDLEACGVELTFGAYVGIAVSAFVVFVLVVVLVSYLCCRNRHNRAGTVLNVSSTPAHQEEMVVIHTPVIVQTQTPVVEQVVYPPPQYDPYSQPQYQPTVVYPPPNTAHSTATYSAY